MTACPACAAENADDARFCSELRPATRGRGGLGMAERRLVTVLFADITGSTPLGEALDPEDLQDVLGSYAAAMRQEIEAEGGTVEKFIGDAVMAVFRRAGRARGRPVAGASRGSQDAPPLGELNDALEQPSRRPARDADRREHRRRRRLARAARRGRIVTGDAVNAAASLEQTADAGSDPRRRAHRPCGAGFRLPRRRRSDGEGEVAAGRDGRAA